MKAKVLKLFRDKDTGDLFMPNAFYEGDEKRLKALAKKGFVEYEAKEDDVKSVKKETKGSKRGNE